jgi:hypothetical protein
MMRMRLRSTIRGLPAGSSNRDRMPSPIHLQVLAMRPRRVLVILLAGQQPGEPHSATLIRNTARSMLSLPTTKQTTTKPSEQVSQPSCLQLQQSGDYRSQVSLAPASILHLDVLNRPLYVLFLSLLL